MLQEYSSISKLYKIIYSDKYKYHVVWQGCTYPKYQVDMATKFGAVASTICGSSVRNLFH